MRSITPHSHPFVLLVCYASFHPLPAFLFSLFHPLSSRNLFSMNLCTWSDFIFWKQRGSEFQFYLGPVIFGKLQDIETRVCDIVTSYCWILSAIGAYQRIADKFLTSWWNNEFSSVSLLPVQFSLSFFSTPYETKTTTTRHGTGKTNNVEFRYWKWKTEIEIYRRIDVPRLYVQMKSTWADKWNPLTGKIYVCQFSGLAGEKKRIAESRFGFTSEIPNKIHETTDRSARVPLSEMCLKFEKTFRTIS